MMAEPPSSGSAGVSGACIGCICHRLRACDSLTLSDCGLAECVLAAGPLTWPCTWGRVMDDLHELQAFLAQRSAELASGAGEALSASAPEAVQVPTMDPALHCTRHICRAAQAGALKEFHCFSYA